MRPPARPLPAVSFADGKPTEAGLQAFDLIVWAAQRIDAPVVLSGPEAERSALATSLEERGVRVRQVNGNGQSGMVSAAWGMPDG